MNQKAKEASVDSWVEDQLKNLALHPRQKTTGIPEIDKAIPSKQSQKNRGEIDVYVQSKNFHIIFENKPDTEKQAKYANFQKDTLLALSDGGEGFAENEALFYAQTIIAKTIYKEFFVVGVSADIDNSTNQVLRKKIRPIFVDQFGYTLLEPLEDFSVFAQDNIQEFYNVAVRGDLPKKDRELIEINKFVKVMHEDLRNYGNIEGERKAAIISVILLALEYPEFDPTELQGRLEVNQSDGEKIWLAMKTYVEDIKKLQNDTKLNEIYDQFSFIRTDITLNKINQNLGMTPLKYYSIKIQEQITSRIKTSDIDILGNFYGEFVKYAGGDGNSLGIVLTPRHITDLMADLINLTKDDIILDPCCGTGSFLISSMNKMFQQAAKDPTKIQEIKEKQLFGIELQQKLFAVASTNMILRGDGHSNIIRANLFDIDDSQYNQKIDKILMNPPYSQAKSKELWELSEINFIRKALGMIKQGGKLAVIVPQSTMVGKNTQHHKIKRDILESHTLESVITLNPQTFHGVGVNPCIAIFTAGIPQADQTTNFIDFQNDGYSIRKHIGLIDNGFALERKKHLLRVLNPAINEPEHSEFIIRTEINGDDEWLHSFYYFNPQIPQRETFFEIVADYLTFKFQVYSHKQGTIFNPNANLTNPHPLSNTETHDKHQLDNLLWKPFKVSQIFEIKNSSAHHKTNLSYKPDGIPYITRSKESNALDSIVDYQGKTNPSNVITFGAETAIFKFQPFQFITGNKMYFLYRKDRQLLTENCGLFVSTMCQSSLVNTGYGYGMGLTGSRFKERQIMLPVDPQNRPNWLFMEEFIDDIKSEIKTFTLKTFE
jgi:type I restriction-modification system DNA methylase subunit